MKIIRFTISLESSFSLNAPNNLRTDITLINELETEKANLPCLIDEAVNEEEYLLEHYHQSETYIKIAARALKKMRPNIGVTN